MQLSFDQTVQIVLVVIAMLLVQPFYRLVGITRAVEEASVLRSAALGTVTICGLFFILSRASDLVLMALESLR